MHIDQIPLVRLSVSKANMRAGKKPPEISDILPSIIKRGVISPLFVRPNCTPGHFEIVAGKRQGQLDRTEVRAQMPTGSGHVADQKTADLRGQLVQLVRSEGAQVCG